jgi:hypothetical protein
MPFIMKKRAKSVKGPIIIAKTINPRTDPIGTPIMKPKQHLSLFK